MPYIIKTKQLKTGTYDESRSGMPGPIQTHTLPTLTQFAVATLDDAREYVQEITEGGLPDESRQDITRLLLAARDLPDAGGTIGPLPDGTVIEVQRVTWEGMAFHTNMKPEFVRVLNHGGDVDAFHARMIDAFNEGN